MYNFLGGYPMMSTGWTPFFSLLILWELFWKAWALWVAARKGQKIWFGVLLVINLFGILEILYIFIFSKNDVKDKIMNALEKNNEPIQEEDKKVEEVKKEEVIETKQEEPLVEKNEVMPTEETEMKKIDSIPEMLEEKSEETPIEEKVQEEVSVQEKEEDEKIENVEPVAEEEKKEE